jgi:hypothetical protein
LPVAVAVVDVTAHQMPCLALVVWVVDLLVSLEFLNQVMQLQTPAEGEEHPLIKVEAVGQV